MVISISSRLQGKDLCCHWTVDDSVTLTFDQTHQSYQGLLNRLTETSYSHDRVVDRGQDRPLILAQDRILVEAAPLLGQPSYRLHHLPWHRPSWLRQARAEAEVPEADSLLDPVGGSLHVHILLEEDLLDRSHRDLLVGSLPFPSDRSHHEAAVDHCMGRAEDLCGCLVFFPA